MTIPEKVFLGGNDIPGARQERPSDDDDAYLRPPRPCGSAGASDAQRLAAARVHYLAYDPVRPTWPQRPIDLLHVVMVFEDGGAERYLDEFRAELRRCPQGVAPEHRYWKLVREGVAGDSVLATATPSSDGGGMPTRQQIPVLVARADNAVVILADLGYEASAGDRQPLLDLVRPAVERARAAL